MNQICKFYVNAYLQRQNQNIFTKLIGNEGVAFFTLFINIFSHLKL